VRLQKEGGVRLVYEVDKERMKPGEVVDPQNQATAVARRIDAPHLARAIAGPGDGVTVEVAGDDEEELAMIKKLLAAQGRLEFRILADPTEDAALIERARKEGDVKEPDVDARRGSEDEVVRNLVQMAEKEEQKRVSALRDSKKSAPSQYVMFDDRPRAKWIDVPAKDIEAARADKDLVTRTVDDKMQKLVVLGQPKARWVNVGKDHRGNLRIPTEDKETVSRPNGDGIDVLVKIDLQHVDGKHLKKTQVVQDDRLGFKVWFEFDNQGGRLFGALTGDNVPKGDVTRKLGIILDDTVLSAPALRSRISDKGEITGDFTKAEVEWLVSVLNSGSFPAPLKPQPVREEKIQPVKP
jgi:SecD/SecF fusion protein